VLEITDLHAGYGRMEVLHGINAAAVKGRPTVIMGANGVGKTTLCRCITGLIPVRNGTIRLDGEDITNLSPADRVKRGIALVPEGRQVFSEMTVRDNLRIGAFVHGEPSTAELDQVTQMFPILSERYGQMAGLLSGGEQQMLALARALMSRPRVLLLDEPSQGLAPKAVEQVGVAVNKIAQEGMTVLLVEQNLTLAEMTAKHAIVLESGTVTAEGSADHLFTSGAVEASYLGH
jgi:branched-chain amino acid transport system ATP-binding protein